MSIVISIIKVLSVAYLVFGAIFYFIQRDILYHPKSFVDDKYYHYKYYI